MTTDNFKEQENNEEVNETQVDEVTEGNVETTDSLPEENTTDSTGTFEVGDIVKGTVYKVEDKFVKAHIEDSDFEGIVPISQLTNKRIERPEEIVSEEDTIEGVVIKVEDEEDRKNVIFSIRKLDEANAYEKLQDAKDNDETITGKVMEVVKAGLVVDVGVRGFIPASLLSDAYIEDLDQFH